jgi:hypothetical protein
VCIIYTTKAKKKIKKSYVYNLYHGSKIYAHNFFNKNVRCIIYTTTEAKVLHITFFNKKSYVYNLYY